MIQSWKGCTFSFCELDNSQDSINVCFENLTVGYDIIYTACVGYKYKQNIVTLTHKLNGFLVLYKHTHKLFELS